jgi:hypothetical protein
MRIILAAVLLIAMMACASCEAPPGVPTTVYGIARDSDGDPVGPGKTVEVYVNGVLYQSVKTFAGAQSDSIYVLTFEEGDVSSSDKLTFKIAGKVAGGTITFGSLDDVESLNLQVESTTTGGSGSNGGSGGSGGTTGGGVSTAGTGGIQLPPFQGAPAEGSGQADVDGDDSPPEGEGGAIRAQEGAAAEAGQDTGPAGAAVAGDSAWLFGLGLLAGVALAFLIVKGKGSKRKYSIER